MGTEIVVVSGLPRSGTSLMMQMLAAGGVEVVTDGQRIADDDNPAGYYEYEPVKMLQRDASWLATVCGKTVKIISQLLFELPTTEHYAVILMERDLGEVLASQDKMLTRQGRQGAPHATMRSAFEKHLARLASWLPEQAHMRVLRVDYADLVADPLTHAERIKEFLGSDLNVAATAAAVDPKLYRNRKG
jgi:hypothetical protein